MKMALNRPAEQWAQVLGDRKSFDASSLYGSPVSPGMRYSGQLPGKYDQMLSRADYIVWSYQTPIAWHDPAEGLWIVPDVSYSTTTRRQQNVIRAAAQQLNDAARDRRRDAAST